MSNKPLKQDNVFVKSQILSTKDVTGIEPRTGLEQVIVSEGKIVNVVSAKYGHLPNEKFFYEAESKLVDAGIQYETESINRDNQSFKVNYILSLEDFNINIKPHEVPGTWSKTLDIVRPMLTFVNSYDGSCKTSAHFSFHRKVCSNGLEITHKDIGFSFKHRGNIVEIVLPKMDEVIKRFLDNEFYSLQRKFQVLAEKPLSANELKDFVKLVLDKTGLFKYEASKENPEPSLNSRLVLDTITREAHELGTEPNLWLGYNAFNEILHGKLKKSFEEQKKFDGKLFDTVLSLAN